MSINRKLKKYVDEMPVAGKENVLPAEALKKTEKPKSFKRIAYAGVGFACAAAVAVSAIAISGRTANVQKKGVVQEQVVNKPIYGDGEINGEGNPFNKDDMFSDGMVLEGPAVAPDKGIVYEEDYMKPGEEPLHNDSIAAGQLTGGELRDLPNWDNYLRNMNASTLKKWDVLTDNRVSVYVHNGDTPLCNATVKLMEGDKVLFTAKTNAYGFAYLFYNLDGGQANPDTILVGEDSYKLSEVANSKREAEIELSKDNEELNIDLMFMVDTTGSMGDELEFLKAEVQDVIERAEKETGKKIRTSVNFYRDSTDEYVVKYYDFRDDASEVKKLVAEQSANGGGDFPEAVCEAMDNALNTHNWNENSIKLMFIILDAPPHSEKAKELSKLMCQAAEMGVRLIPVMSSGADDETVSLFRSYAVMTGGTYLFLDDKSGIGYSHTIPSDANDYDSEFVNDMMIRVIGEYAGVELQANKVPVTPAPTQPNEQ